MVNDAQLGSAPAPFVAIVIPTCDRRDSLARCLEALTRQTYADFEIVVVDDCSADGTPQMLREYADRYPQIALTGLRNETNLGANPSRNRGIRAARGEIVAFLDSDCVPEPDWLAHLLRGFTQPSVAAVTGLVVDAPPANIYDLAFKGTHRLHRAGAAHRLVAGNLAVRRAALLKYRLDEDQLPPAAASDGRPDVSVSGQCDEEGLFLLLRAAGYEQRVVPEAVVRHEHHLVRSTFFRQAFRGGRSAARLVYKFHLSPRLDMLPFLLTYLAVPLALVWPWLWTMPGFFLAAALGAITYNDRVRKGKAWGEIARTFPLLVAYYHVRLCGYVLEALRLRLTTYGIERVHLDSVAREI